MLKCETRKIAWGSDKQKMLKEIFSRGFELTDTVNMSTTRATYGLANGNDDVAFTDLSCELNDKFQYLLK
jgi:hypothetical protein